jgi:hypothetical protein
MLIFMHKALASLLIFMHNVCVQRGQDGPAPHLGGNEMKIQTFALILQIIVAAALIANIVHHW